jgi:hypothetical protein
MSKIVQNTVGFDISLADVGVTIASMTSYTIPAQDHLIWAASSDVIVYVGNGNLVISDGSSNLSPSDGIDLLKGVFPSKLTDYVSSLKNDNRLKVEIDFAEGISTIVGPMGPAGVDGNTILSGTADPTTEGVDGDFYINTSTYIIFGPKGAGVWPNGVPLSGAGGGVLKSELITLSSTDIANKQLTFSEIPYEESAIQLIPVGGPVQVLFLDYVISGSVVNWGGLGLDGILAEGDQIQIFYQLGV